MTDRGSNPVSFEDTSNTEAYLTVAKEYDLSPDHGAVSEIVRLRSDLLAMGQEANLVSENERRALVALVEVMDLHDLTDEAYQKLKVDKMTGLRTRDAFFEDIDTKRAILHQTAASGLPGHDAAFFIMIDIRSMHKINKKGGHPAGDDILSATGWTLRHLVRPGQPIDTIAGRLGGDEFGLLATLDTSKITIEEAQESLISQLSLWGIDHTPYGIRIGDTAISSSEKEVADLLKEADPKRPQSRKQKIGKAAVNLLYKLRR